MSPMALMTSTRGSAIGGRGGGTERWSTAAGVGACGGAAAWSPSGGTEVGSVARLSTPPLLPRLETISASGPSAKLGRASCRARVCLYVYISVVAVSLNKQTIPLYLLQQTT